MHLWDHLDNSSDTHVTWGCQLARYCTALSGINKTRRSEQIIKVESADIIELVTQLFFVFINVDTYECMEQEEEMMCTISITMLAAAHQKEFTIADKL